jgi:hypothetical protein
VTPIRALLVLLLATAACTSTVKSTPRPVDPGLSSRLLTEADLPSGFRAFTPASTDRPKSDRPDCEAALHDLEIAKGDVEARAAFTTDGGTGVQHIVRAYPGDGARAALRSATATLRTCDRFTLRYPDGLTATESVVERSAADDEWTGDVVVDMGSLVLHDRLTVFVAADRLTVLSVVTPDGPAADLTDPLVAKVRAKLD